VGRGGEGPTPLASQRRWRVYEENDFPLKATDKVGGSLLEIDKKLLLRELRIRKGLLYVAGILSQPAVLG
jgi:hypothetical protein